MNYQELNKRKTIIESELEKLKCSISEIENILEVEYKLKPDEDIRLVIGKLQSLKEARNQEIQKLESELNNDLLAIEEQLNAKN